MVLTQSQIEKKLSNEHLDELLGLWQTEQGAAKRRELELMAATLPSLCFRLYFAKRKHRRPVCALTLLVGAAP